MEDQVSGFFSQQGDDEEEEEEEEGTKRLHFTPQVACRRRGGKCSSWTKASTVRRYSTFVKSTRLVIV
jgi:hypothetical protein